jgi:cell division septum initiation protein DivIVA
MTRHWSHALDKLGACEEAVTWARKQHSFAQAWTACERLEWMEWLLDNVGWPDGARAEYDRIRAPAWAEYARVMAAASAEYDRVAAPAWVEYKRVTAAASAEYDRVAAPAWVEYKRVTAAALVEYDRVRAPAWAKYKRVTTPALHRIVPASEAARLLRNATAPARKAGRK